MNSIRHVILVSIVVAAAGACGAKGGKKSGDGGGATGDTAGTTGGGAAAGGGGVTGAGGMGTGGGGAAGGGGGGVVTTPMTCAVQPSACSDGKDNDGDGKVDLLDSECVGPCDNDEGSFATGIPGDNVDACKQDCFFDGNSGQGDDGCNWDLRCDPKNPGKFAAKACEYDPGYKNCPGPQSDRCVKACQRLAPNGCDCFGCCAVTVAGVTKSILLVPTCKEGVFGNEMLCPPCTQQPSCVNTCEKCEICAGKPAPDPSCPGLSPPDGGVWDAGSAAGSDAGAPRPVVPPAPQCPAGVTSCGTGGQVAADRCPTGTFCLTGCCIKLIE